MTEPNLSDKKLEVRWSTKTLSASVILGVGQIILQQRVLTGIFFLAAICWLSPFMALAALSGSIIGLGWARWRRYPAKEIQSGLYGFNAALIALAVAQVPLTSLIEIGWVIIGALACIVVATSITAILTRKGIPAYTAPFVVIVWLQLGLWMDMGLVPSFADPIPLGDEGMHWPEAILWSFGQIMFLNNSISGLLVLIGIALASPKAALWGIIAAAGATFIAVGIGWDAALVSQGLFGYNAVLVAIALLHAPWIWRVLGIALSCLIMHSMLSLGWIALTAPFVLSTWLILCRLHAKHGSN